SVSWARSPSGSDSGSGSVAISARRRGDAGQLDACTDVPMWRALRLASADVLCARSVRRGQSQIGRCGRPPSSRARAADTARIAASGAMESSGSRLGRDGWSRLGETVLVTASETGFAKIGGGQVCYQVVGTGPPDVLVEKSPYLPVDLMWDEPRFVRFLNGLSSFSRHIWFDFRGTGSSDAIEAVD